MSAKKKAKTNRVSVADQIRLGPEVAAAKGKMTPAQWRLLVKTAHSRGFTVAGQLSNAPDALKERTKKSITAEAAKNTATAFAPAAAELGSQEAQIRALDAKRQTDNAHFQAWLAQQQSNIASRAAAADSVLASQQATIQQQTQQGYAQAAQQAAQAGAASAGNVSDPGQAKAFDFSGAANRANELVANQRTASAQMANNSATRNAGYAQVGLALGREAENKRQSDTTGSLTKVADAKNKLRLDQADAASKEIARLFGVEQTKADANRNYAAAASQLGIKQQELALDARKLNLDARTTDRTLKLKEKQVSQAKAIADAKLKLGYDKLVQDKGKAAADRKLKVYLDKQRAKRDKTGGAKAPTSGEKNASTKAITTLGQIAADIRRLQGKGTKRPLRGIIEGKGATSTQYEIALDLAEDGRLGAYNQKRAREELGIIVPSTWK